MFVTFLDSGSYIKVTRKVTHVLPVRAWKIGACNFVTSFLSQINSKRDFGPKLKNRCFRKRLRVFSPKKVTSLLLAPLRLGNVVTFQKLHQVTAFLGNACLPACLQFLEKLHLRLQKSYTFLGGGMNEPV